MAEHSAVRRTPAIPRPQVCGYCRRQRASSCARSRTRSRGGRRSRYRCGTGGLPGFAGRNTRGTVAGAG